MIIIARDTPLKILLIINIFIFLAFPLGFGGLIKYFSFTLMLVFFLLSNKNKIHKQTFALYMCLFIVLLISFTHFVVSDYFYVESFTLLQSLFISILIFMILTTSYANGVIEYGEIAKYAIIGLVAYSIFKTMVSAFIFVNILNIEFLKYISPDFASLGYIGITGFNRIVGVNDFLLPFVYFFIKDSSIKHKKIVSFIFILSIFLSFTRSMWASFLLLFIIEQIFIKRKLSVIFLFGVSLVALIYYLTIYTSIDLIGSIQNRLFNEGALSSSVKVEQAEHMLSQISQNPFFGGGLGSYIPDYLRNDRLKYGYEVMLLALVMQNGLIFSFIILCIIGMAVYKVYQVNGNVFYLFSLGLFVASGLTNPIIISSVSVFLYSLYAIKFMTRNSLARNIR